MAGKTGLTVEKIDEMIEDLELTKKELERSRQDVKRLTCDVLRLRMIMIDYQKKLWSKEAELLVARNGGEQ